MTNPDLSAELPCHLCGYDLRAHPQNGRCPECGASVAESLRLAATPRRPAWPESDPRWRRRMLVGTWILVLLPLMDVLTATEWASSVPVPTVFNYFGTVRTLDDTLLCWPGVYEVIAFCVGVVLLFSKERGRHRGRLDWTCRWGVICSYVVLLLRAAQVLFIAALVLVGISMLLMTMPLKLQSGVTELFVKVSTGYLLYGAHPRQMAGIVLATFSSITILLACVPLFDALRSSGPKRVAAVLLAPLALFALLHLAQAGYCLRSPVGALGDVSHYEVYFFPQPLAEAMAGRQRVWGFVYASQPMTLGVIVVVEAVKWCIMLAVAVWLSIAQLAAWRQARRAAIA